MITIFKASVVLSVLLDGVVGEMHLGFINLLGIKSELDTRRSDVTFLEHVHFEVLGDEHPHPDIELPAVDQ